MAVSIRIHAGFCSTGVWVVESGVFRADDLGVFEVLENPDAVADVFVLHGGAFVCWIFSLYGARARATELDCAGNFAAVCVGGDLLGSALGGGAANSGSHAKVGFWSRACPD